MAKLPAQLTFNILWWMGLWWEGHIYTPDDSLQKQ